MRSGIELRDDADFDYALHYKRDVEIRLEGEVDYIGKLLRYTRDMIEAPNGDLYLRKVVKVKIV